jgi:hypothetical protein
MGPTGFNRCTSPAPYHELVKQRELRGERGENAVQRLGLGVARGARQARELRYQRAEPRVVRQRRQALDDARSVAAGTSCHETKQRLDKKPGDHDTGIWIYTNLSARGLQPLRAFELWGMNWVQLVQLSSPWRTRRGRTRPCAPLTTAPGWSRRARTSF